MKKYISPVYVDEGISVVDIVLSSITDGIKDVGQGTVGNISGDKAVFENNFSNIF